MTTILIIEDNLEVRENTAEILELSDYKVLTASNGKEGVAIAKSELPDLIICDIMMPELDGYGVLHILNKDPKTINIPFIFLTAKAEKDDFRKGMNLGADDYLTKPFDDLALLDAIEMRMKKNQHLKSVNTSSKGTELEKIKGLEELDRLINDQKSISSIPIKHHIFSEGSYPNFLFYVLNGKIKTSKTDKAGNEFITGLYKTGDFLGYTDLLENTMYTENATALEESELSSIPKDLFFKLLHSSPEVAGKFIKILSDNVLEKEERLIRLAYCSVRKRVAEALLLLQKKYQEDNNEAFTISISREDLSSIVGASKETVIRTLSDFKEEGLISILGRKISIENKEKLQALRN
jgi:CheY-like chemotaxis protein/CRP-like cAMP-binding protein